MKATVDVSYAPVLGGDVEDGDLVQCWGGNPDSAYETVACVAADELGHVLIFEKRWPTYMLCPVRPHWWSRTRKVWLPIGPPLPITRRVKTGETVVVKTVARTTTSSVIRPEDQ